MHPASARLADLTLDTSVEWRLVAHRVRRRVARAALRTAGHHPAGKSVSAVGAAP